MQSPIQSFHFFNFSSEKKREKNGMENHREFMEEFPWPQKIINSCYSKQLLQSGTYNKCTQSNTNIKIHFISKATRLIWQNLLLTLLVNKQQLHFWRIKSEALFFKALMKFYLRYFSIYILLYHLFKKKFYIFSFNCNFIWFKFNFDSYPVVKRAVLRIRNRFKSKRSNHLCLRRVPDETGQV